MSRTPSCACGQASITVDSNPQMHGVCHCANCKRRTGGAFADEGLPEPAHSVTHRKNEAWLALRGLKTFPLRMARQCESAFRVARFLEGHPAVARVRYPGLPSHPDHATARRLFPEGRYGAMLSFDVADCDTAKAFRFLDALRLVLSATGIAQGAFAANVDTVTTPAVTASPLLEYFSDATYTAPSFEYA